VPVNGSVAENYINSSEEPARIRQFDIKIDARKGRKTPLVPVLRGTELHAFPLNVDSFNHGPFQNGVIQLDPHFSPKIVNELRSGEPIVSWTVARKGRDGESQRSWEFQAGTSGRECSG